MKYIRAALFTLIALLCVACGDPTATSVSSSPTLGASPAATSASATSAPALTSAPAATTAAPQITYPPTITAAPTVAAQPVAAGTWWANSTCYEIFVRSFFDSNGDGIGDLKGLTSKLDYLNDGKNDPKTSLGVKCLWLMPIMASPSYHGYDTTDYYAVNPQYGTNDDFKTLMTEAHKRGIKIILDLVINHTSNENAWFKDAVSNPASPYRDWYIFSPTSPGWKTPWGAQAWWPTGKGDYYYAIFDKSQPDLNFRNADVTKKMYDVSRFWLQDMGADGYRVDAAKHLIENGADQQNTLETKAWFRAWEAYVRSIKPDAYTVGEINGSDNQLKGWYPDMLDQYFEFGVAGGLLNAANAGNGSTLAFNLSVAGNLTAYNRYAPFLTNHDQDRAASVFKTDIAAKTKVAATLLLTMPGTPFIYYGEEVGAAGGLGTGGDRDRRTPMQWSADPATAGFTTGSAWYAPNASTKDYNVAAQTGDPTSILNYYRRLIAFRSAHPALSSGSIAVVHADNDNNGSLTAFVRKGDKETLLVVVNTDAKELPAGATLTVDKSDLAAGTYNAADILNTTPGFGTLTVGANGAITGYSLPALAARTGFVLRLGQ